MREILTLQVGSYANYIGAHFWNFQDELLGLSEDSEADAVFHNSEQDIDVLFRTGEKEKAYTPRLIAIDLRGGLGAVNSSGSAKTLPGNTASVTSWNGRVSTHRSELHVKNEFLQRLEQEEESENGNDEELSTDHSIVQNLENSVQFWTDYSKTRLHFSSLYEIQGMWHGVTPFGDFGAGRGVLKEPDRDEELRNRVRRFAEECDHMQGFQLFVDVSAGFAGVAADVMEVLVDEYERSPMLLFTARPPLCSTSNGYTSKNKLHDAVSFASLSALADLIVPVGLVDLGGSSFARNLVVDNSKPFYSSAVYAAAISNITLPFRMNRNEHVGLESSHSGSCNIGNMMGVLSCSSARKAAAFYSALPMPPLADTGHGVFNVGQLEPLNSDIVDATKVDQSADFLVFQGARIAGCEGIAPIPHVLTKVLEAGKKIGSPAFHISSSLCPLPIPLPFPCLFGPSVGSYGNIVDSVTGGNCGRGGLNVFHVPVGSRLSMSAAIAPYIEKNSTNLYQFGLKRGAMGKMLLENWGFPEAEADDLGNALADMTASFKIGNGSSSDLD